MADAQVRVVFDTPENRAAYESFIRSINGRSVNAPLSFGGGGRGGGGGGGRAPSSIGGVSESLDPPSLEDIAGLLPTGDSGGGGGGGGSGTSGLRKFLGPLSRRLGPAAIAYAALEEVANQQGVRRAMASFNGADDSISMNRARIGEIEAQRAGFFHGLKDEFVGLSGGRDSVTKIARLEAQSRFTATDNQIRNSGLASGVDAAERAGFAGGGSFGAQRARISASAAAEQAKLAHENRELALANQEASANPSDILRRERLISANTVKAGELGAQAKFETDAIVRQDALARRGQVNSFRTQADVSTRTADALQSPAYNRDIEVQQAQLTALKGQHNREEGQYERELKEKYGSINSPRARELLNQQANAHASQETEQQARINTAIKDRTSGEIFENSARAESRGEAQAILRGDSPTRAALERRHGENLAHERFLQRQGDPSAPDVARTNRATEAANKYRVDESERQVSGSIAFGNESLAILSDKSQGRYYSERARQAQTNDIVRQTQLAAYATTNEGDRARLFRRGRLEIQNQEEQYVNSFRVQEVSLNRTASTGDAQKVLSKMEKAMENLQKVPSKEDLRQLIDDAVKKLDQAN